jgi:GDP-4-dehydro-6-deoxy-D-mannose reductase
VEKCVVIGAGGFIGQHVMASSGIFLRDLGASLIAASAVDVRDASSVKAMLREIAPRHVIHLAALTFVPDSFADPLATFEVNLLGTLNVLSALVESGFSGRMLFVSSAEVFGAVPEQAMPVRESQPFAPRTPYAVSKAAAELACLQHALLGKVDVSIARPFNVIGAGQSSKFAVSSFARQIAELDARGGGEIAVGNLDVTRDFVSVQDTVSGFAAILAAGSAGEAYNICSGTETQIQEILDRLLAVARTPIAVRFDSSRARLAEQRRVIGSYQKLNSATGWKPSVDLANTLQQVIDHWRTSLHII